MLTLITAVSNSFKADLLDRTRIFGKIGTKLLKSSDLFQKTFENSNFLMSSQ